MPLILPISSKNFTSDKLDVNLPKSYFAINIDGKNKISDYSQIQIDLLNAYLQHPKTVRNLDNLGHPQTL